MNLTPGTIQSWEELCARFTANFSSAYQQHGVEAHLHAVRQKPGEMLRAFISRLTKVRGTIPHISDASIITAFRQGYVMRRCSRSWRRMRWKALPRFSPWQTSVPGPLRAAHGTLPPRRRRQDWWLRGYRPGRWQEKEEQEPESRGAATRRYSRCSGGTSRYAAVGGQNAHSKRPCLQGGSGGSCPVHPTARHSAADCREIQKLAKWVSRRREQSSKDGSPPPRQRSGKEKASDSETDAGEKELGYQSPSCSANK